MERNQHPTTQRSDRQLAHLKLISRLLSHELRAQNSPRVTLSRDEVLEIQTALDLYIEEIQRRSSGGAASFAGHGGVAAIGGNGVGGVAAPAASELEVRALPTRNN